MWFQLHTVEHVSLPPSQKSREGRELLLSFFIVYKVSTSQKLTFWNLWMFGIAQDSEEQWGENLEQSSNLEVEFFELIYKSHLSPHWSREELRKKRAFYVLSLHKVLRKEKLSYKSGTFRLHVLGSANTSSIFNQTQAYLDSIRPNSPKCGRAHILFSNH